MFSSNGIDVRPVLNEHLANCIAIVCCGPLYAREFKSLVLSLHLNLLPSALCPLPSALCPAIPHSPAQHTDHHSRERQNLRSETPTCSGVAPSASFQSGPALPLSNNSFTSLSSPRIQSLMISSSSGGCACPPPLPSCPPSALRRCACACSSEAAIISRISTPWSASAVIVIGNTARLFAVPNAELPLLMLPKPGPVTLEVLFVCLCELLLAMEQVVG
ncbi:hypothetical protein L211DRAFT_213910 [Terfezia boudieri ATCC MYA-4762]|uniref:Uncharacterized protein n=1 Tax=Terfezia boudieri ATCC MYA-4762 TaxID=1051890 RepID=A0A3N4LN00_9PEZI|nr:hypothetical protein L211DRAFT_213910 [Terfezia boudieri ATCC MYA-4762]